MKRQEHDISVLIVLVNSEGSDESAHAQTRQSLRCSHTQSRGFDKGLDQNRPLSHYRILPVSRDIG